jgi:uncharacterized protein (DUF952 family)
MKNNVYKILSTEEWEQVSRDGHIKTDLNKEDGFIHLSFASQLHSTLSRFFDESDNAILLQLNLAALDIQKLVFEESFGDACKRKVIFPHLYSTLMLCQVSKNWILKGEAFYLPEEVMLEVKNIQETS